MPIIRGGDGADESFATLPVRGPRASIAAGIAFRGEGSNLIYRRRYFESQRGGRGVNTFASACNFAVHR